MTSPATAAAPATPASSPAPSAPARTGHATSADGLALWWEERGPADGPPVLLLQGVDASSCWWPPALVDGLVAAGLRVVVMDNRDIGLSSWVDPDAFAASPYGVAEMAADARAVLDERGIVAAHLVGQSLGGMIAQQVALTVPERVLSLTLLTTTPGPDERLAPSHDEAFAALDRPVETPEDAGELAVDFGRALAGSRFGFDEPAYRALLAADEARGTNPAGHHQQVVPAAASRLDALAAVTVPALVVAGTEDPIFPVDHGEALARALPAAELVRWEGVGHEVPPALVPGLVERVVALVTVTGRH